MDGDMTSPLLDADPRAQTWMAQQQLQQQQDQQQPSWLDNGVLMHNWHVSQLPLGAQYAAAPQALTVTPHGQYVLAPQQAGPALMTNPLGQLVLMAPGPNMAGMPYAPGAWGPHGVHDMMRMLSPNQEMQPVHTMEGAAWPHQQQQQPQAYGRPAADGNKVDTGQQQAAAKQATPSGHKDASRIDQIPRPLSILWRPFTRYLMGSESSRLFPDLKHLADFNSTLQFEVAGRLLPSLHPVRLVQSDPSGPHWVSDRFAEGLAGVPWHAFATAEMRWRLGSEGQLVMAFQQLPDNLIALLQAAGGSQQGQQPTPTVPAQSNFQDPGSGASALGPGRPTPNSPSASVQSGRGANNLSGAVAGTAGGMAISSGTGVGPTPPTMCAPGSDAGNSVGGAGAAAELGTLRIDATGQAGRASGGTDGIVCVGLQQQGQVVLLPAAGTAAFKPGSQDGSQQQQGLGSGSDPGQVVYSLPESGTTTFEPLTATAVGGHTGAGGATTLLTSGGTLLPLTSLGMPCTSTRDVQATNPAAAAASGGQDLPPRAKRRALSGKASGGGEQQAGEQRQLAGLAGTGTVTWINRTTTANAGIDGNGDGAAAPNQSLERSSLTVSNSSSPAPHQQAQHQQEHSQGQQPQQQVQAQQQQPQQLQATQSSSLDGNVSKSEVPQYTMAPYPSVASAPGQYIMLGQDGSMSAAPWAHMLAGGQPSSAPMVLQMPSAAGPPQIVLGPPPGAAWSQSLAGPSYFSLQPPRQLGPTAVTDSMGRVMYLAPSRGPSQTIVDMSGGAGGQGATHMIDTGYGQLVPMHGEMWPGYGLGGVMTMGVDAGDKDTHDVGVGQGVNSGVIVGGVHGRMMTMSSPQSQISQASRGAALTMGGGHRHPDAGFGGGGQDHGGGHTGKETKLKRKAPEPRTAPRAQPASRIASYLADQDLVLPSYNRRIVGRNFYLGRTFMSAMFGANFQCPLQCSMRLQINGVLEPKVYQVEFVSGSTSWYPRGLPLSLLRGREMCGARWQTLEGGETVNNPGAINDVNGAGASGGSGSDGGGEGSIQRFRNRMLIMVFQDVEAPPRPPGLPEASEGAGSMPPPPAVVAAAAGIPHRPEAVLARPVAIQVGDGVEDGGQNVMVTGSVAQAVDAQQ